jgi:hypothetical protein
MTKKLLMVPSKGGLIPHTHILAIDTDFVKNPPEAGLTLETNHAYSLVYKHSHQVFISQSDFQRIAKGESVVLKDSDKGRHSFEVTMKKEVP